MVPNQSVFNSFITTTIPKLSLKDLFRILIDGFCVLHFLKFPILFQELHLHFLFSLLREYTFPFKEIIYFSVYLFRFLVDGWFPCEPLHLLLFKYS